jgi:hypothetical protein
MEGSRRNEFDKRNTEIDFCQSSEHEESACPNSAKNKWAVKQGPHV